MDFHVHTQVMRARHLSSPHWQRMVYAHLAITLNMCMNAGTMGVVQYVVSILMVPHHFGLQVLAYAQLVIQKGPGVFFFAAKPHKISIDMGALGVSIAFAHTPLPNSELAT